MLFNTLTFAVFLPLVFLLYWFWANKEVRRRNMFIIFASYVFYGWWDWRFLGLIFLSSLIDYLVAAQLDRTQTPGKRKILLWITLASNLGILGFFKYFNFFLENAVLLLQTLGFEPHVSTLKIILPLGISFYTFQTMSYTIDVYRGHLKSAKHWSDFFAYVSFFPQLVAGPIERAIQLMPQFATPSAFRMDQAKDGMRQILWGLFKKAVVADNCALIVDHIFGQYESIPAPYLILGALAFSFQIYGDFSGYSDMAIGMARLFGFTLMRNFAYPYFARDIAEFWRRWHVSLTTWFRDYVYIPLGGSRLSRGITLRNTLIVFLVSGFWHGANWTFIVWGLLHALFFFPLILRQTHRIHLETIDPSRWLPRWHEALGMLSTFSLVTLSWIFFRSREVSAALGYLQGILSWQGGSVEYFFPPRVVEVIILLMVVEWLQRDRPHGLDLTPIPQTWLRWVIYLSLSVLIMMRGHFGNMNFIYFAF